MIFLNFPEHFLLFLAIAMEYKYVRLKREDKTKKQTLLNIIYSVNISYQRKIRWWSFNENGVMWN